MTLLVVVSLYTLFSRWLVVCVVMLFAEGVLMASLRAFVSRVPLNVTSHILFSLFHGPVNINLFLRYLFNYFSFTVASHPASHNCPIDKSDA